MSRFIGNVSAYAYAVSKGYTGTEEEFAELMASYATVGQTAVEAAETATTKASEAATSATTATNKASEATTAAQTATTKAGEAQTSAQTASSKASEASQSASQASGYAQTAETAKTDAQTAKTQAETARDNTVTAKTAAETAQGKAEDAQAAAERVAESITSDYSQLFEDVSDLKEDLNSINESLYLTLDNINTSSYTENTYMSYNNTYDVIGYGASANYITIKLYPLPSKASKLRITGRSGINGVVLPLVAFYDNKTANPPKEMSYITQTGIVDYNNETVEVPAGALWFSITFRVGFDFKVELVVDTKEVINDIGDRVTSLEKRPAYRVLIIGDSYSKNGQWVTTLQNELNVNSLVNLAVVSASLKDKYQDRTQYPYTSRPVSSDNVGNHNTFMCQIEKLKRLMAGTDLDSGESKIYSVETEYPNVIIIEGGQNDSPDAESVVETYPEQMMKYVDDVYVARTTSDTPSVRDCYIKTPFDEVNRTCFAGAYRVLVEELQLLFPKAQIFATSRSLLGYWLNNHFPNVTKIYQQQEISCNMCGINFINWQGGSQINTIRNYPKGDGTQSNPYTYAEVDAIDGVTGKMDTYDLLHPTILGGKKYGRVVANAIKANYINIGDE